MYLNTKHCCACEVILTWKEGGETCTYPPVWFIDTECNGPQLTVFHWTSDNISIILLNGGTAIENNSDLLPLENWPDISKIKVPLPAFCVTKSTNLFWLIWYDMLGLWDISGMEAKRNIWYIHLFLCFGSFSCFCSWECVVSFSGSHKSQTLEITDTNSTLFYCIFIFWFLQNLKIKAEGQNVQHFPPKYSVLKYPTNLLSTIWCCCQY